MDRCSPRHQRIETLESTIPALQKELDSLLADLKNECPHTYGIGWKITTTGFVMTRGEIGCPECGLSGFVTDGGYDPILPAAFLGKPIHWITQNLWRHLFYKSTLAGRLQLLVPLGLDKPPAS